MLCCLLLLAASVTGIAIKRDNTSYPTVDLGYSQVQAAAFNDSLDFYTYKNIRFAAPPIGDLRWRPPQAPLQESSINNGSVGNDCDTAEDCLFLDVYAPPSKQNLPVMVFVYGGGFSAGSKDQNTPEGLFNITNDFIFVAANYRLGMTALANGPTIMHNGTANVGLWDVAYTFQWVKQYISKFGGNPNLVTGSGFSAGASQILFQVTRFAGQAAQLFEQAYVMSPGFVPGAGHQHAELFWQNVSTACGCSGGDVGCMRQVDFTTLQDAGTEVYTNYTYQYQPRVDGGFVADTYESLLYTNRFNFTGPMVLSHAQHEMNNAAVATVNTSSDVTAYLQTFFPAITDDVIEEALALYPSTDYTSEGLRAADMRQSFDLTAKHLAATHALDNMTWNVEFGISPATHGSDQSYYFYGQNSAVSTMSGTRAGSNNTGSAAVTASASAPSAAASGSMSAPGNGNNTTNGGNSTSTNGPGGTSMGGGGQMSSVNETIAIAMQRLLMSFVLTGDPNAMFADERPFWPRYQSNTTTLIINNTFASGFQIGTDDLANNRSAFWNRALWY